ncbi:MAG: SUMF1/EgtB/PvdO family nonheme iron enzyme [Parachlamydiaceae bacterium]|nr:SUMF1/EgtB/PvdO family nonheme iron enzyme [Parachlamydiaceae bacterium]
MGDPKTFGDYTVIKQIGQGTLGAVYLAEHRFMKRQYVLKVLPEELCTDRQFIQRLEEEVALLASLEHPNIVKIHNISFAQGHYFLVTDCIVDELGETTNLAQYILARDKKLDEEQIFRLLYQVADALQYAHSKKITGKGIAHRGIKLNNILVGNSKSGDAELYLSDFGLSRIIGAGAVLSRTYQVVGDALGVGTALAASKMSQRYPNPPLDHTKLSPLHLSFLQNYAFLAPEQKRLDTTVGVDHKADIYAFGILAYYMLMGELPEGVFEMPSERLFDHSKNWDSLIRTCLYSDAKKRPEFILSALQTIETAQELATAVFIPEQKDEIPQQPVVPGKLKPVIRTTQLERPETDPDPASVFQIDTTVKYYVPERKEVKNMQPLLTDMVVVPGGAFYRGSNDGNRDETPRHQVTLDSFAIDIHPVTNEQFVRFLEAMGGEKDSNHQDIIRLRDSRVKRSGGKVSIESGYSKHPVVGVTWYGAVAYAKWIGKRLPTEAEWEIAACGGMEATLYPTGEDIEKTQANFFSSDTTPVMSYAMNGYGIYDMAGNVYEWCHDWYGYNYYEVSLQEPENPNGPLQGVYRALRGGCWKSLKEDLRCSRRHRNNPGTVNGTYGFRCAADVQ